MFEPINLSAYADPLLDELASGPLQLDDTIFFDVIRQTEGAVLELGCGMGRATIPLAQRGVDITGVELSAPSLTYAKQRAGELPIRWVEADIRDFHLDTTYDLVFARGTVFQFMLTRIDQEAMLACVREHMRASAQFMFDVWYISPDKMIDSQEEMAWYTLTHPDQRQIFVSGTDRFDHAQQHYIQTCYERWEKPDGDLVRPSWELTLRYLLPQEMEAILHCNGFKITAQYADWDGFPTTQNRPFGIYICEKC
jgi:SAM-dependent methyltransferase